MRRRCDQSQPTPTKVNADGSGSGSTSTRLSTPPVYTVNARQSTLRLRLRYTLRAVAAVAFVALVCSFCLKSDLTNTVVEELDHENVSDRSPSTPVRVPSNEHANITQFFPCISDVSLPPYLSEIEPILTADRMKTRDPKHDDLNCAPIDKGMCFRAVHDGFAELLVDVHSGDHYAFHSVQDKIAVLIESLILPSESRGVISSESRPKRRKPIGLKAVLNKPTPINRQNGATLTMHADYFEDDNFIYTAILYDDPPEDLLGGETYMVDFTTTDDNGRSDESNPSTSKRKAIFGLKLADNTTAILPDAKSAPIYNLNDKLVEFSSGIIIEPKHGRLLLFTGGGENFHAYTEVTRGTRPAFIFWFKCQER